MAEYINEKDTLNQGRKKLNKSIEQSERAEDKSNQAVNTSNNAMNIARQSDDKSDDTQQQLDDIIIDSGTSDAEVIQARGGLPLLKDRLNKTDAQLAETEQQINSLEEDKIDITQAATKNELSNKISKGTVIRSDLDKSQDANKWDLDDFNESSRQAILEANGIDINYVLGDDSIVSDNLTNDSVISTKRTALGEMAVFYSLDSSQRFINLNLDSKQFEIPVGALTYRNKRTIIDPVNVYFTESSKTTLFYNVSDGSFLTAYASDLGNVTEDHVMVMTVDFTGIGQTVVNSVISVNGCLIDGVRWDMSFSDKRTNLGEFATFVTAGTSDFIDINLVNKSIDIAEGSRISYRDKSKYISESLSIDFVPHSENTLVYNTQSEELRLITHPGYMNEFDLTIMVVKFTGAGMSEVKDVWFSGTYSINGEVQRGDTIINEGDIYIEGEGGAIEGVTNVTHFGAIGDGISDDTNNIRNAINDGVGGVIAFPPGIYLVSDTIKIPSNTELLGIGNATIKLKDGAKLPVILPHPDQDVSYRQYKALVTTESAGNLGILTENSKITNLILDSNNQSGFEGGEEYAVVTLWIANAKNVTVDNVRVLNSNNLDRQLGRSAGVSFTYTYSCSLINSYVQEGGYETLGVRYENHNLDIINCRLDSNSDLHIIEIAGYSKGSELQGGSPQKTRIINCDLYLDGNTMDAVSIHGGGVDQEVLMEGCTITVLPTSNSKLGDGEAHQALVKTFNDPNFFRFINNYIDFREWDVVTDAPPRLISMNSANFLIQGNIIRGSMAHVQNYTEVDQPLIGTGLTAGNWNYGRYIDNDIVIDGRIPNGGIKVIGIRGNNNIIRGNSYHGQARVSDNPTFITLAGTSYGCIVSENTTGLGGATVGTGVWLMDDVKDNIISNNIVKSKEEFILKDTIHDNIVINNIVRD